MHRNYAERKKRASLVPAAAVIPALRAYIKVVAFKTPVVEIFVWRCAFSLLSAVCGKGGEERDRKEVCEEKREWRGRRCGVCLSD